MKLFNTRNFTVFCILLLFTTSFVKSNSENSKQNEDTKVTMSKDKYYESDERFQRPSKIPAVELKYNFHLNYPNVPPYIASGYPELYESSEDVVHGYFSTIKNAANMTGYYGGCGTILWNDSAFPYAYRLFTNEREELVSLESFKESFKGTGATNLIQLLPAYKPKNTPNNIDYYFIETEVLKGYPISDNEKVMPNYFEYYYGIVTTRYDKEYGWQIESIDYLPEIYLCHPQHGWDYYYDSFIEIIYNSWYKMNLNITNEVIEDNIITVYANNNTDEYKFIFVRLANGDDVLLHEYKKQDDDWKEVSLLEGDNENHYKMSILKFRGKND
ncbi:hypothetical protein RI065_06475 [Mycoplasmatota bacterium zrk1]